MNANDKKNAPGEGQKNGMVFFEGTAKVEKISDTNKNFLSVLKNLEDCEMSGIGHVFENKDLRLKNTPDPLAGVRKLATLREWRLKRYQENMSEKQKDGILEELRDLNEVISNFEAQKYEVWGLISQYLEQLPKGLGAVVITLPLSTSGKGLATIDLMSRKAVICKYAEEGEE